MMIKLSDEAIASLGIKNAAEFPAAFSALVAQKVLLETSTKENFAAFETRLAALEARGVGITEAQVKALIPASLTEAQVKEFAAIAGSAAAVKAVGSIGGAPVAPSPAPAQPASANSTEQVMAAGKFEEAFALLPIEQRAEFPDAKAFAAYMKAKGRGVVNINTRN